MIEFEARTPHDIHLYPRDTPDVIDPADPQAPKPIHTVTPPPGEPAVRFDVEEIGELQIGGVDFVFLRPCGTSGLPEYAGDMNPADRSVWYFVSTVAALSARGLRGDLVVRHRTVRDPGGRILGARALGILVAESQPPPADTGFEPVDLDAVRQRGIHVAQILQTTTWPCGLPPVFAQHLSSDVSAMMQEIEDLRRRASELQAQRTQALEACDRMMLGQLSPSGIVAEVREALRWTPTAGRMTATTPSPSRTVLVHRPPPGIKDTNEEEIFMPSDAPEPPYDHRWFRCRHCNILYVSVNKRPSVTAVHERHAAWDHEERCATRA